MIRISFQFCHIQFCMLTQKNKNVFILVVLTNNHVHIIRIYHTYVIKVKINTLFQGKILKQKQYFINKKFDNSIHVVIYLNLFCRMQLL